MNNFDILFAKKLAGGGSPPPVLIEKNITANGTYTASDDSADGYSSVSVAVPNSYTAQDEGKVVSNGALVAQTAMSTEITANDTYDTTLYNSVTVNVPQGGGTSAAKKDVNFYDYDGTVVASYTASDFAELTVMPANPTHTGLTAQGWNWTLSDAKTYVASYGKLNIGQMYITSDGKTRLYIRLGEGRLKPYLGLTGNSNTAVSIDWGDNSAEESVSINNLTSYIPHEYDSAGEYIIAITVTNGSIKFTGNSSKKSNIFRKSNTPDSNADAVYRCSLIGLEIGANVSVCEDYSFSSCFKLETVTIPTGVTFGTSCFKNCLSLRSITFPTGVTSIGGDSALESCSSLSSIAIPNSVTSLNYNCCKGCVSLFEITIPNSVTTIGINSFANCNSLSSITIPNGVTSLEDSAVSNNPALSEIIIPSSVTTIGNDTFGNDYGLGFIKFHSSTPATANSRAFGNIPTDCIIYVPTGSLSAYTSANNYPSSSTYTYVEY